VISNNDLNRLRNVRRAGQSGAVDGRESLIWSVSGNPQTCDTLPIVMIVSGGGGGP
jgi:hypothetical protein